MRIRFLELEMTFKRKTELISFSDFNYFYGQMGAGKSTIARIIDFCMGGKLGKSEMTPALQNEFVSSSLSLQIESTALHLHRNVGSDFIRAQWVYRDETVEVMIPSRKADGEVLPGSGIEVLSDLVYVIGGKTPPKVRKSKIKEESELGRLSIRDLFWYCYLDQDSMDSSFFHLGKGADPFKRLKSRDVLRFLVGFYQERVSELEVKLELCRNERLKCEAGATAIQEALTESDIATGMELAGMRTELEQKIGAVENEIRSTREKLSGMRPHAMEGLQEKARSWSIQIDGLEGASSEIKNMIAKDKAHRNELLSISTRLRRSQSAREVLGGVRYEDCPQCGRVLPVREEQDCSICGVTYSDSTTGNLDEAAAEKDLESRVKELGELIERHEKVLRRNRRKLREACVERNSVDNELDRIAADYDSLYLSVALEIEKERAAMRQELVDLERIEALVDKIAELFDKVDVLIEEEKKIRAELKNTRKKAEKDTQNLGRLKELFLDCLVRARLAGFYSDDVVTMQPPHFLPEIVSSKLGDLAVTSFGNLGSGGKKTLFKCCFSIAVHRLAFELDALVPSFLIIDSPMKNISERENREQFEGFFEMLYDLSSDELEGTQFIVIDKEKCDPPDGYAKTFLERHMKPNERGTDPKLNAFPPLISYYQGK